MRGVPDHSNPSKYQPVAPAISVAVPSTFTLKEPISEDMIALGCEVLSLVPRKDRGSLEAFRLAAKQMSDFFEAIGIKKASPKILYYLALRVKWLQDNVGQ